MFRTIKWFLYFMWTLVLSLFKLKKIKKLKRNGKDVSEIVDKIVKKWCDDLLDLADVNVKVKGEKNLISDRAVLYVCNHQSNFDIPILISKIKDRKGFIAKIELKKFLIVNKWMNEINCVFMDRNDIRQSAKTIIEGIRILKNGHSMVVFPEGTRSIDGKLIDFKPGAMKLALKSKVPIVPVTINGSKNIMPKGSKIIYANEVELVIDKPIYYEDYGNLDTSELTEKVKNIIESNLKN